MTKTKITEILREHEKWLRGEGGCRADLSEADLRGANLTRADLSEADLTRANLCGADLREANLTRADLTRADLSEANLTRADLCGADLRGAELQLPDINILKDQPSNVRLVAYKFLNEKLVSPFQAFQYEVGKTYRVKYFDTDERNSCGAGLNVATRQWCEQNKNSESILVKVSFRAKDIVAIPYATDGKFRVKAMKIEEIVKEE